MELLCPDLKFHLHKRPLPVANHQAQLVFVRRSGAFLPKIASRACEPASTTPKGSQIHFCPHLHLECPCRRYKKRSRAIFAQNCPSTARANVKQGAQSHFCPNLCLKCPTGNGCPEPLCPSLCLKSSNAQEASVGDSAGGGSCFHLFGGMCETIYVGIIHVDQPLDYFGYACEVATPFLKHLSIHRLHMS